MKKGTARSTPGEGEIKARVAQLTALHKTLLDITAQRDLTKLLQAIVQRAARLLKGTSGGLYLCDAEKQECTCVVSYKTPRDYTGTVLRYGEGAAGKVAASGQPLQIDDYRAWEGHAKAFEPEQPFRAVLAAPLLWHGGVTGVIDMLREQPFTQADLELLTMVASQAAIAVENARALEVERATRIQLEKDITERKRAEEALRRSQQETVHVNRLLLALSQASQAVQRALTTEEVYRAIQDQVTQLGYYATGFELAQDGQSLHIAFLNYRPELVRKGEKMAGLSLRDFRFHPRADSIFLRVITQGETVFIKDTAQAVADVLPKKLRSLARPMTDLFKLDQSIYTPMKVGDETIGILSITGSDLTKADNPAVMAFAQQAAIAMQNARLYERAQQEIAERKRAEEEIQFLARFPSENPNPILRIARDGTLLYINEAGLSLLADWHLQVGKEVPPMLREAVFQSMDNGSTQALDLEHGERVYSFYVAPIVVAGYANLYGHDITERKQMETELHITLEKYRVLFGSFPLGISVTDAAGNLIEVNRESERLLGIPSDEHKRRKYDGPEWRIVRPDGTPMPPDEYASVRALREKRLVENVEMGIVKGGGEITWISVTAAPIPLEGYGVAIAYGDITERKRMEETLRESERRFRLLYEKAPLGYQSLDAAGCFIDVNQAWLDTLGYSREEVIGRWFGDFLAPHEVEAFKQRFPKFKATGEIHVEVEMVRKDGTHTIIDIVGRIAHDEHGGFKQTHCILTDITERKRAEEALRESRARLAHLSHSLVEAQEEERRRIARELHDEVGQSLTVLTISLDSVSQLASDGVMRGKIAEIQEVTKNLFAEVSALSLELRPRVLDDLGLIPGLLSLFSRFSTQTGVEIDFKHTGIGRKQVTPEIEISAYRIIQEALTNVVRHAGVKTASVRLQVEGDILYIQVQDEGKGFDLQKALSAEDSLGLLSMTERAEQVGGHLEVETAPGEGALITCRLPLGGSHVE
jgi:PAS domain S-box-containing protein